MAPFCETPEWMMKHSWMIFLWTNHFMSRSITIKIVGMCVNLLKVRETECRSKKIWQINKQRCSRLDILCVWCVWFTHVRVTLCECWSLKGTFNVTFWAQRTLENWPAGKVSINMRKTLNPSVKCMGLIFKSFTWNFMKAILKMRRTMKWCILIVLKRKDRNIV